jgi:hypothetical protein
MHRAFTSLTLPLLLIAAAACSGNVGRYADKHVEDSVAEVKTRNLAPRTLVGAERDSMIRMMDSLRDALLKKAGLDSAILKDIPQGFARVIEGDGTTYLRPLTQKEIEDSQGDAHQPKDFGDIIAYDLEGHEIGKAGYKERGKPYTINTTGLPPGTYMLSIPGEKQMKKIVVQ